MLTHWLDVDSAAQAGTNRVQVICVRPPAVENSSNAKQDTRTNTDTN